MQILKMVSLLLLLTDAAEQQILSSEEYEHCGQYGFRCVDSESFQICTYADLDGQTESPEPVRKCLDHNMCDEDNPAYCTPMDRIENESMWKVPSGKCGKKEFSKRSRVGNILGKIDDDVPAQKNVNGLKDLNLRISDDDTNPFGFDNDETDIETTTSETNSDDYPSINNQKFECESFGYFPDIYNASMFWHCDHQNKGKGYIVRHMLCSSGRVFNPVHKECVMIGTTRNIRNDQSHSFVTYNNQPDEVISRYLTSPLDKTFIKTKRGRFNNIATTDFAFHFKKFSCKNRLPGKYPDQSNCRLYHYCLPRRFGAPFNKLTFLCPDHLAYDDDKETCNRISYERCSETLPPHEHKMLHIEVDAIVLQKQRCKLDLRRHNNADCPADCSEYHLCYNDKMVHLKCPDSYRFDENLLTCQPQHLVTCEY